MSAVSHKSEMAADANSRSLDNGEAQRVPTLRQGAFASLPWRVRFPARQPDQVGALTNKQPSADRTRQFRCIQKSDLLHHTGLNGLAIDRLGKAPILDGVVQIQA